MTDSEAIRILLEYSDVLTPSNILWFALRFIGWGLIKLLEILVNSAQGNLNTIMKYLNFFDSTVVDNIIDKIKPIALIFLTLSLLYIGYQLMINRKKFDLSRIPSNVIVAIIIIFFLPTAMKSLGDITKESFKMFTADESTIATEVISSNITDVYLYDQNNFQDKNIEPKNRIDKNKITKIDPTEEIDRSKVTNKKVFENKIIPAITDSDESYDLERINGWFKIDSEYYRWDINFFQIIFTLLISAVVLIFTMVKVVKLMFELAFSKVFIIGGALADISHGQKTKQMLMHIISIYIAIVSIGLTLQLYILGTAWLNDRVSGFASIMINLGTSLFVIDGPNLLEKIFGVDAGLSSGLRVLMGINSGMDILSKVGRGIGAVAEMGKKGLEAGAILGAGLKGFKDGAIPDLEDEMNNVNAGFNPFQNSLPEFGDIKSLGDGNSDDDLFTSMNDNSPNDFPPSNGGDNEISDFDDNESGLSNLDNSLYNGEIPNLNDDIENDDIFNKEFDKEQGSLDNFNNGLSLMDDEGRYSDEVPKGNNSLDKNNNIANKNKGRDSDNINALKKDAKRLNNDSNNNKVNDDLKNKKLNDDLFDNINKDKYKLDDNKNEAKSRDIQGKSFKDGNLDRNNNSNNELGKKSLELNDRNDDIQAANKDLNSNLDTGINEISSNGALKNDKIGNSNNISREELGRNVDNLGNRNTNVPKFNESLNDRSIDNMKDNISGISSNDLLRNNKIGDSNSISREGLGRNVDNLGNRNTNIPKFNESLNDRSVDNMKGNVSGISSNNLSRNNNIEYPNNTSSRVLGSNSENLSNINKGISKANIDLAPNNISNSSPHRTIKGDNFEMYDSNSGINTSKKSNGEKNFNIVKAEERNWQYGRNPNSEYKNNNNTNNDFSYGINLGGRNRVYNSPKYIDPNETRNIKDMLIGAMGSKVKNSNLVNNMKTSYKIGNNTAKDLRRYVGIKEQEIKDKILLEKIRRNL